MSYMNRGLLSLSFWYFRILKDTYIIRNIYQSTRSWCYSRLPSKRNLNTLDFHKMTIQFVMCHRSMYIINRSFKLELRNSNFLFTWLWYSYIYFSVTFKFNVHFLYMFSMQCALQCHTLNILTRRIAVVNTAIRRVLAYRGVFTWTPRASALLSRVNKIENAAFFRENKILTTASSRQVGKTRWLYCNIF